jgi:hypothetical protein
MAEEEKNLSNYSVELTINGKKIGLNPYVKSVFIHVVFGMVKTLKNVNEPEQITIEVQSKK